MVEHLAPGSSVELSSPAGRGSTHLLAAPVNTRRRFSPEVIARRTHARRTDDATVAQVDPLLQCVLAGDAGVVRRLSGQGAAMESLAIHSLCRMRAGLGRRP